MNENNLFGKTHQIFKNAINALGLSYMTRLWGKSHMRLSSWSADPNHCQIHYVNPLKKIEIMLVELQKQKQEHIVKVALELLVKPLGYRIAPKTEFSTDKSFPAVFKSFTLNSADMLKLSVEYSEENPLNNRKKHEIEIVIYNLKQKLTELKMMLDG